MADFTNRNADETKQFILTFDENGGSPEYTKIEDANGVDRTEEVVELLGINDKEDADPTILKEGDVEDSLNSTSTTKPLSANQGKQLNDDKASLSVAKNIVSITKKDTFSEAIGGRPEKTGDVTGLIANITPSSEDSKILLFGHVSTGVAVNPIIHVYADGVEIALADSAGSRIRAHAESTSHTDSAAIQLNFSILHSPNTTDEIEYTIRLSHRSTSASTLYVNRSVDDSDANARTRTVSTITAIEVP